MVADLLVRTIGKRIDNKFAEKNPQFRELIYSILSQGEILDGKLKVIYLTPDEVHHFRPPYGGDEYGLSVYAKILFTAKLYMATLTSTLMSRLVKGPDKRVFYVEVGVDNGIESAIQSFIRDIKSRDLRLDNLGNLTTIFQSVGQFQDLYIPVVDGQKPIEIETISGTDVNLDNDFLEYLRKSMVSGLGLPSSLLQSGDEVEFARTLSMQNSRFARTITTYQKVYGEIFSNLLRALYKNEYFEREIKEAKENLKKNNTDKNNIENNEDEVDPKTDIRKIFVRFPPPYLS